jgi:hypothetical protein
MKVRADSISFACYSAACRPPSSGGTGGSSKGGSRPDTVRRHARGDRNPDAESMDDDGDGLAGYRSLMKKDPSEWYGGANYKGDKSVSPAVQAAWDKTSAKQAADDVAKMADFRVKDEADDFRKYPAYAKKAGPHRVKAILDAEEARGLNKKGGVGPRGQRTDPVKKGNVIERIVNKYLDATERSAWKAREKAMEKRARKG